MKIVSLLSEAQNYMEMFNDIPWETLPTKDILPLKERIRTAVAKVKSVLKRNDRVIWYLRLVKIGAWAEVLQLTRKSANSVPFLVRIANKWQMLPTDLIGPETSIHDISSALRYLVNLEHYMSLPVPDIQNYVFGWQKILELSNDLQRLEQEWRKSLSAMIPYDPDDFKEIIMDFKDGWFWVDLGRGSCKDEADAMGHCGNVPSESKGDTILSLRKLIDAGPEGKYWEPHLTFILDKDGFIGESKGRGNDKPAERYHPYIVALLKLPMIHGIKGGGYLPAHNFRLTDLSDDVRAELQNDKPALLNPLEDLMNNGWDIGNGEDIAAILSVETKSKWAYNSQTNEMYLENDFDIDYEVENILGKADEYLWEISKQKYIDDDDMSQLFENLDAHDLHDFIIKVLNIMYKQTPELYHRLAELCDDHGQLSLFDEKHISPSEIIHMLEHDPDNELSKIMNSVLGRGYLLERILRFTGILVNSFSVSRGNIAEIDGAYHLAFSTYDFDSETEDADDPETYIDRIDWMVDYVENGHEDGFYFENFLREMQEAKFIIPSPKELGHGQYLPEHISEKDMQIILDFFYKSMFNVGAIEAALKTALEPKVGQDEPTV